MTKEEKGKYLTELPRAQKRKQINFLRRVKPRVTKKRLFFSFEFF